jgi:tRNA U34 2-thiouridine synthase MnmA/TrmU
VKSIPQKGANGNRVSKKSLQTGDKGGGMCYTVRQSKGAQAGTASVQFEKAEDSYEYTRKTAFSEKSGDHGGYALWK